MGKAKTNGGLGFRDLMSFNMTTLLAKQGQRLLRFPHSLASRVLKWKYFPKVNFMKAELGSQTSYIQISILAIMAIRPLLEKGTYQRISNERDVHIWKDKWLLKAYNHKIKSVVKVLDDDTKVMDLVDLDTKHWKLSLIDEIFKQEEVDAIKKMPISSYSRPDRLVWQGSTDS